MSIERGFESGQEDLDQEHQDQLNRIIERANTGDVTFKLFQWFGDRMRQNDPKLLEIQRQGFISEAVRWLESTTPEGMKYGTATEGERLKKAHEFAQKAEVSIEKLAKEHGIEL